MTSNQSSYSVKEITFQGQRKRIILQNENGPCPLIAICNVLILRGKLELTGPQTSLTTLLNSLVNTMSDAAGAMGTMEHANDCQNLHDAIGVVSNLARGLDVNVKFTGPTAFEYTSEMAVFDLCDVRLLHGWLPDPQLTELMELIAHRSYNQLIETTVGANEEIGRLTSLIDASPGAGHEVMEWRAQRDVASRHALLLQEFLNSSASQLTYYGLEKLHATMNDGALAVIFRNNHFSTLHKYQGALYALVTDQGFLGEPHIVWERLREVDGDSDFVTSDFKPSSSVRSPSQKQYNSHTDEEMARRVQQEEYTRTGVSSPPSRAPVFQSIPTAAPAHGVVEGDAYVEAIPATHGEYPVYAVPVSAERKKDCVIS